MRLGLTVGDLEAKLRSVMASQGFLRSRVNDLNSQVQDLTAELVAVQQTLGIMPQGSHGDVAKRLEEIEGKLYG